MVQEAKIASLYVHFPFCETKCHYCDFYSLGRERTQQNDPPSFAAALRQEAIQSASRFASELETVFFGGGTPSMTPASVMSQALESILTTGRITSNTEWTMEANPSSVELESLKAYRKLGVNRISMGVQSLRDDHLKMLGRVHSRDAAFRALEALFSAGFENVSVDLLCGVPGQTLSDLETALKELTRYPITHLSCYLLTLAPHHRMYPELPDEETQLSHLLFLDQWMTQNGFEHYEISNFAKPEKRARHNLRYWTGESYLGLGPSAHSFDAHRGARWKNVSSLHKYTNLLQMGSSALDWEETLTTEQKNLEKWMLGLRLEEGFPITWLESDNQRAKIKQYKVEGLMEDHPDKTGFLRLTPRGFALSDPVIASLACN